MSDFNGKSAIVTGGASGIGKSLTKLLIEQGARVLIADITGAQESAQELGCEGAALDVTDHEAVKRCVEDFAQSQGGLDYIFNNAGILVVGDAKDMSYEDWHNVISINLMGVVNGVFAAYPIMIAQGHGHIVNTGSLAGLLPSPTAVPYSTSKFGVVGLTQSLRAEARRYGVKVSAICPGFISTPMADNSKFVGGLDRKKSNDSVKLVGGYISSDELASRALKGVSRNQELIVIPTKIRLLASFLRRFPELGTMFTNLMASGMKKP
ncbi:MAG: NAD(P)-dependent dehydrogenase (short-subunit alcohol dehydrogenase family) [Bacteroidia bacterium]|jgi:NAD(P)-dependent dehydrogenase (short-subunit alcohol dehydrogenase family)